MLLEIGHYCLTLGIILLIMQIFWNIRTSNTYSLKNVNKLNISICIPIYFILITISISCLFYSCITSNFYVINILEHSHSKEPLLYKICGLWGNHEGSMLLWCWILSLYSFMIVLLSETLSKAFLLKIINYASIINLFFVSFTLFTSNPFLTLTFFSLEGTELNPILQDPGLAIHPPLLYIGYIGTSISYLILLAYISSPQKKDFTSVISLINTWVSISWTFLTLGILLGSWWAYYELGWGGWWFWDPVENASLIPWITLTALLHSINASYKQNKLTLWTIYLTIFTFFNSLSGTFFVRSGLLTSVHSFSQDSSRGIFILIFLVGLSLYTIKLLVNYFKLEVYDNTDFRYQSVLSKYFSIHLNNIFLLTFSLITILGTVGPVFFKYFLDRNISAGSPFYNSFIGPLIIPFLMVMMVSPFLSWINTKIELYSFKKVIKEYLGLFMFSFIFIAFILSKLQELPIIPKVILILTFSGMISLLYYAYRIKKLDSVFFAHFGFFFLVTAIVISTNLQIESIQLVKPGDIITLGDYQFIFRSINYLNGPNYTNFYGDFLVRNSLLDNICVLFPEKRFYMTQGIYTIKAAIKSNFLSDFYAIIDDGNLSEGWYTRVYYSPLMAYIWVAPSLIIFSGLKLINSNIITKYREKLSYF